MDSGHKVVTAPKVSVVLKLLCCKVLGRPLNAVQNRERENRSVKTQKRNPKNQVGQTFMAKELSESVSGKLYRNIGAQPFGNRPKF